MYPGRIGGFEGGQCSPYRDDVGSALQIRKCACGTNLEVDVEGRIVCSAQNEEHHKRNLGPTVAPPTLLVCVTHMRQFFLALALCLLAIPYDSSKQLGCNDQFISIHVILLDGLAGYYL